MHMARVASKVLTGMPQVNFEHMFLRDIKVSHKFAYKRRAEVGKSELYIQLLFYVFRIGQFSRELFLQFATGLLCRPGKYSLEIVLLKFLHSSC
jgi:hypothetical protein